MNPVCPLCGKELEIEYCRDSALLKTTSWRCPTNVSYLSTVQGEYAIVTVDCESITETVEYYYTDICEIVVEIDINITSIMVNSKQEFHFDRRLELDEIKSYMKRLLKVSSFV